MCLDFSCFFVMLYTMSNSDSIFDKTPELSLLSSVKQIVLKKDYNALQNLFIEHLANKEYLRFIPAFWESISYLTKPTIGLISQARDLVELLFEHLYEHNHDIQALEHIRKFSDLMNPDRRRRQEIISLYKRVYADNKNLDTLIRIAEIGESAPLPQSIALLNKLLEFNVQRPVYSSRFGYGEITNIDFLLDTVTINFSKSQSQTITLKQAVKSLQPLPKDNIYFLKENQPQVIIRMIKDAPAELAAIIKRDLPEHHKATEIKQLIKGIVSDEDINLFIEYIKKNKPTHKKTQVKQTMTIDYTLLESSNADAIINLLNNNSSVARQKILSEIKSRRSDWQDLFFSIFFAQTDRRVLQTIFSTLDQVRKKHLIDKTFTEYKRNPDQFLWLVLNMQFDSYAVLYRYLDLAIQYPKEIRKRLVAENYAIIKNSLATMSKEKAEPTLKRIKDIISFYPEEKDKIESIFKQKFPDLFEIKEEYIYHTESAIRNKELELKKIITEEIPKVASEIGQARSYGDLSENFEYKAAMEKQKRLMHKTTTLREELAKARPIDFSRTQLDKVSIGTTVKMQAMTDNSAEITYTILGPWDSDPHKGIISYLAPFAQKLINKKVGDEIIDDEGKKYKITEIIKAL